MKMKIICVVLFAVLAQAIAKNCSGKKSQSKLFCYYSKIKDINSCQCTHIILPPNSDIKSIQRLKDTLSGVKILVTVHEFNEGLINILKNSKVDGLEINLRKLESKNDIGDFISTVKSKLGSDLFIVVSVPAKTETLAKYYDFKTLTKSTDLFVLQTAFLGANKNVTFHPSRLSGMWDMQNTDSVVDLVSGLGAPLSKLVIATPVQAFRFTLQDEAHTAPGSPALDVVSLPRNELCAKMSKYNWTLERDQDQAGPYIFRNNEWIAFEDHMSVDIKAKYSRVRGLAGLALKDLSQDGGEKCGQTMLQAAYVGLSKQARAPRGAVLHSLEREILETPARPLDTVQVSPYRISRVIDVEGNVHVIRKDTRTEFSCSRQGYFVHPRSCGRFYRCVKFDQLTDEFNVFEFDCPAGLAFDARVEVCVWPGSLPHGSPCSGSSEIAPVPKERFVCPHEPGYYADPENCRWFFACLDHGKSPLSAYEFRCPFGLVFDEGRLLCEWSWLVPKCASGNGLGGIYGVEQASVTFYGGAAGQGPHLQLETYDGLGQLGTVALGGIHGPLSKPVAKVYTSFGSPSGNSLELGGAVLSTGLPSGGAVLTTVGHSGGAILTTGSHAGGRGFGAGVHSGEAILSAGERLSGSSGGHLVGTGAGGVIHSQGESILSSGGRGFGAGKDYQSNIGVVQHGNDQFDSTNYLSASGGGFDSGKNALHVINVNEGASLLQGVGVVGGSTADFGVDVSGGNDQGGLHVAVVDEGSSGFRKDSNEYTDGQGKVSFGYGSYDSNEFGGSSIGGSSFAGLSQGGDQDTLHVAVVDDGATGFGRGSATYKTSSLGLGLTSDFGKTNFNTADAFKTTVSGFGRGHQQQNQAFNHRTSSLNRGSSTFLNTDSAFKTGQQFGTTIIHADGQGALDSSNEFNKLSVGTSSSHGTSTNLNTGNYKISFGTDDARSKVNLQKSSNFADVNIALGDFQGGSLVKPNDKLNIGHFVNHGESNQGQGKSTVVYQANYLQPAGKIDIVSGGYSAVGTGLTSGLSTESELSSGLGVSNSAVQITHAGANLDTEDHVSATPIPYVTSTTIPVVTSVPIPTSHASGIESFRGGVVANIPELQYKVSSPGTSNVYFQSKHKSNRVHSSSRGDSGQSNLKTHFINTVTPTRFTTVSSTPRPFVSSTISPIILESSGYDNGNSAQSYSTFKQSNFGQRVTHTGPSVAIQQQPAVVATYEEPSIVVAHEKPAAVSTHSVVTTHQQPSIVSTYQQPSVVSTYQQPSVVSTYQQPSVVSTYQQPSVVSTYQQPSVVSTYQQPAVVSTHQTPVVSTYKKPSVVSTVSYEKPAAISTHSTVTTHQQPSIVSTYQQPAVVSTYQQPSIVSTYQQPAVVSTYKQPEVVQTFKQPAVVSTYEQPSVVTTYHQPAVVTTHEQPSVVSTYSQPSTTLDQGSVSTFGKSKSSDATSYVQTNVEHSKPSIVSGGFAFRDNSQQSGVNLDTNYQYEKSSFTFGTKTSKAPVALVENVKFAQPEVVTTYQQPAIISTYDETPKTYPSGSSSFVQTNVEHRKQPSVFLKETQQSSVLTTGFHYGQPKVTFGVKTENLPISTVEQHVEHENYDSSDGDQGAKSFGSVQFGFKTPLAVVKPAIEQTVITETKPAVSYIEHSTPASVSNVHFGTGNFQNSYTSGRKDYQQSEYRIGHEQPSVQFVETKKPTVTYIEEHQKIVKPAVVSSFSYSHPVGVQKTVVTNTAPAISTVEQQVHHVSNQEYQYSKPSLTYEQAPRKPAVISSFTITQPSVEKTFVSSTPSPAISFVEHHVQPQVIQKTFISSTPVPELSLVHHVEPQIVQHAQPHFVKNTQGPRIVESYQNQRNFQKESKSESYFYEKPKSAISFIQTPVEQDLKAVDVVQPVVHPVVQPVVQTVVQPVAQKAFVTSTLRPALSVVQHNVHHVQPSLVAVEQKPIQPAVVSTYEFKQPIVEKTFVSTTPQPAVSLIEHNVHQVQPALVTFKQKTVQPIISNYEKQTPVITNTFVTSTLKPAFAVGHIPAQPAVVTTYHNTSKAAVIEDYRYEQPSVTIHQQPSLTIHQQPSVTIHQQPSVEYKQASIDFNPSLEIKQQPAVVSSFSIHSQPEEKTVLTGSYNYEKVLTHLQKPVQPVQPAVVATYKYETPQVPTVENTGSYFGKGEEFIREKTIVPTYHYEAPADVTRISTPIQHGVSSFNFQRTDNVQQSKSSDSYDFQRTNTFDHSKSSEGYVYSQQEVTFGDKQVTPTVSTVKVQPTVVSSYHYKKPAVQNVVQTEYTYQPPVVQFSGEKTPIFTTYEGKEPVQEEPFLKKTAYVTGTQAQNQYSYEEQNGYDYEKPAFKFEQKQVVVSSTPKYVENYVAPDVSVEKISYKDANVATDFDNGYYYVSSTAKPQLNVVKTTKVKNNYDNGYYYVSSTPRPTYSSTIATILAEKQPETKSNLQFYNYDSRISSTPRPIYKSTVTPIILEASTQSKPISKYSFSSFDTEYQAPQIISSTVAPVVTPQYVESYVDDTVEISSPKPVQYVPGQVTKVVEDYVKIPSVVVSTPKQVFVEVSTPKQVYVASNEESLQQYNEDNNEQEYVSVKTSTTGRPTQLFKAAKPKSKSYVRVNDFHPFLSAKLGAQCTCTSNSLKIRKKPKQLVVENYQLPSKESAEDDDDGYVVLPNPVNKQDVTVNNDDTIVVENYQYEPERVVEVTPHPEITIKSTTNPIQPAPAPVYTIRKRVRVRPVTSTTVAYIEEEEPVTKAIEVFVGRKSPSSRISYEREGKAVEHLSDQEIGSVVRKGLSLVKSAVKEGVKEGVQEALEGRNFDRYGPGGWRSRDETLQGTIDCQRAGLFRHPTHCNKFYACRWDCNKNRFTLHVFNCPVHLTFDNTLGACNWPSQGPACMGDTLLPSE